MERVRVFSKPLERVYFFLMAVGAALLVAGFFHGIPSGIRYNATFQFVYAFIFLNTTHTIFTYALILALPEFRSWVWVTLQRPRILVILFMIGVIYGCALVMSSRISSGLAIWVAFILTSLSRLHNISQTKGLALLYNQAAQPLLNDERELERHRRVEKVERVLFNVLIASIVALTMLRKVFHVGSDWRPFLIAVGFGAFLLILINSRRYPTAHHSNKSVFLLTIFFNVLSSFAEIAWVVQKALHGMEYAFLCYGMTKRSRVVKNIFLFLGAGAFIGVLVLLKLYAFGLIPRNWVDSKFVPALLVTSFLIEYLHYYFDSLLFRMSDPDVRKFLAPVIGAPPPVFDTNEKPRLSVELNGFSRKHACGFPRSTTSLEVIDH